jgi:hypothetical protein
LPKPASAREPPTSTSCVAAMAQDPFYCVLSNTSVCASTSTCMSAGVCVTPCFFHVTMYLEGPYYICVSAGVYVTPCFFHVTRYLEGPHCISFYFCQCYLTRTLGRPLVNSQCSISNNTATDFIPR